MEISGLAKMGVQEGGGPERLSEAQERELVSAVHALNHWSLDEIVETYALL
jgi:hypothetical protein